MNFHQLKRKEPCCCEFSIRWLHVDASSKQNLKRENPATTKEKERYDASCKQSI